MLIVLLFVYINNKIVNSLDIKVTNKIGSIDNVNLNITYCGKENPFENMLTYSVFNSNIKSVSSHNVRCTYGFANVEPINNYINKSGITSSDFCKKYGSLYMSVYNKGQNYYLFQNVFNDPNCWNLIIEKNGNLEFIKLCDIEKNKEDSFRFAVRMEFKGEYLHIYLDTGLCIVNSKHEVNIQKWDLNKFFGKVCNQDIRPHNSKVQYFDGCLYLLGSSEEYKDYFIIKYNISQEKIQKYKTNYSAQEIFEMNNNIVVLSLDDNKIFLETICNNSVMCQEIKGITNLNLESFKKNTSLTKIINYDRGFYLTLANSDDSNPKNYIFNISYDNSELIGFKEVTLYNKNYNLYGISFFLI